MLHVNEFIITGIEEYVYEIIKAVKDELEILKVEKDKFRFAGLDVEKMEDGSVIVSVAAYVGSIKKITYFRDGSALSLWEKEELILYRQYIGKLMSL